MKIVIEIPQNKADWILALLKDIPEVKILSNDHQPIKNEILTALASSWQPKLSIEDIDERLSEQKNEWL